MQTKKCQTVLRSSQKRAKKYTKKCMKVPKTVGEGEVPKRPGKCQKVPKGAKKYQKVKKKAKKKVPQSSKEFYKDAKMT